ncbi:MAG: cytochrome b/b6 domain-containing protein [Pseudomonadota bacterium]
MTASTARYSAVAIGLHWAIALGIGGMILMGWYMGDLPDDAPNKGALYQLHKSVGISILVLTIARIVWRIINRPPEAPPMPGWQKSASEAVHWAFYGLMILMPLTGWIMVSVSPLGLPTLLFDTVYWPHLPYLPQFDPQTKIDVYPAIENVHSKLAWLAIGLLGLHVAGAVKHHYIDKDGLLARMIPGLFGRTDGPVEKPRGALTAFSAALAFFAVIAIPPMLSAGSSTASAAEGPSNWTVIAEESEIAFSGDYNGAPYGGVFEEWTASISFNEADPDASKVQVVVSTASVVTGQPYYDSTLKEAEWFDVGNFADAVFNADGLFKLDDGGYEATAVLTLKGVDHPVRMPFTLTIDGDRADMNANFTMDRLALGLGLNSDPEAEWVARDVEMSVTLAATRNE